MFKFEKLNVWQKALDFADFIYSESASFPPDERFGLTNQIRRAAVSISSNIAEGSARSDPDFARFIGYASGSLYEVVTQSFIARRRKFLSEASFNRIYTDADEISRMLSGLRDSLGE
ncbi:MAG: four helix bundle protein [Opitutia bacterium]|nr:MAG: four helix bundle protein [Opitutae bacterium]